MPIHPAEEATLRAFVVPAKRDRLLTLLGSDKRRKDATRALDHFRSWDPRWVQTVNSSANVLTVLQRAGGPATCHVISGDLAVDGQEMSLADAVNAAESYSFASVLCCRPGELAFFFDEIAAPRNRWLLRRS